MATPEINENCHYVQNDPHMCKIKLEKFQFDILCRFGVIKESLLGGGGGIRPPGEIRLNKFLSSYKIILSSIQECSLFYRLIYREVFSEKCLKPQIE